MRRVLFALAFAFVGPAFAQGTEAEPQAAPASIAIGMIENAQADGVFELVHDGHATVRHIGSGLVCHFENDGAGGRLILYPNLPRGDDVACDWNNGREFSTIYATRYPFNSTLQEQIDGATTAIRSRFGDAVAMAAPAAPTSGDSLPTRRTVRFIVMREGQRYYTSASVARIGSWIIKLRHSAPAPDDAAATRADEMAATLFSGALSEILNPPRQ